MPHSLFTYLRLKLIVTLMRALTWAGSFFPLRRDRLLSQSQGIVRQRIRIPSRDKGRLINADLYYYPPAGAQHQNPTTLSSLNKTPILVNWHGSGFVFPLLGSDSVFCARIARETGIAVLDADYRKAPETPFPGPVNDVDDVLRWLSAQPERIDLSRVAVSGFSAGGNLALVAATALRKQPPLCDALTIPAVIAIYPVTDISIAPEAKTAPRPRKTIPPHLARIFDDCYVPDKEARADPRVSPSLADPADFPSTVAIITCDGDNLAPEAIALAEKLKQGQRKVVSRILTDVYHGFDKGVQKGSNEWDRREETYTLVVETLKGALNL